MLNTFKEFLKKFLPASSKTLNAKIDNLERLIRANNKQNILTNKDLNMLLDAACWANQISDIHKKVFGPYRGINTGKDTVIVATGPSLNNYTPIKNALHIGVNGAYLNDKIKFDYIFLFDSRGDGRTFDYDSLLHLNCIKFFGKYIKRDHAMNMGIAVNHFDKEGVYPFLVMPKPLKPVIYTDIEYFPLMDWCSIVFPALNFTFYTNPRRIFLVGCDSTDSNDHFNNTYGASDVQGTQIVKGFLALKEFSLRFYPETQIVSVNPVRLKGIFDDVYTQSYLNANPDIKDKLGNNYVLLDDLIGEGEVKI